MTVEKRKYTRKKTAKVARRNTTKKKATVKNVVQVSREARTSPHLPETPKFLEKADTPKRQGPPPVPKSGTKKYFLAKKKTNYVNFEVFKKYSDMCLGILINILCGSFILSCFYGFILAMEKVQTMDMLSFKQTFLSLALAGAIGYLVRES